VICTGELRKCKAKKKKKSDKKPRIDEDKNKID